jgi:hypothetical protein
VRASVITILTALPFLYAQSPQAKPALSALIEDADRALKVPPLSVMNKKLTPPSGDKHDYMSVATYWWPDPSKPDGLPYIRRDGETTPARNSDDTDRRSIGRMLSAVDALALAYRETGKEAYAVHAAKLARAWFLDAATRMNPNLNFGQGIPGRVDGRAAGIIDTRGFTELARSLAWIEKSKAWSAADREGMKKWFIEYAGWLTESKIGRDEAAATNNHGTWYDVQIASMNLYAGRNDEARKILEGARARRIDAQIEPDGRQPRETDRTRGFSYSVMNLRGFVELATLAEPFKLDLWRYQSPRGGSIRRALDYLVPYVSGEKEWPYQQLGGMTDSAKMEIAPILRRAAIVYREPAYEALLAKLPAKAIETHRMQILWPPR